MVVQMIILNIYHKTHLTPVPKWLKRAQQILICHGSMRVADIPIGQKPESTNKALHMPNSADKTHVKAPTKNNNGVPIENCDGSDEISDEALQQEWQKVARMMDQIFFVVFLLLQVSLIIGIVSVIPWAWVYWLSAEKHPLAHQWRTRRWGVWLCV